MKISHSINLKILYVNSYFHSQYECLCTLHVSLNNALQTAFNISTVNVNVKQKRMLAHNIHNLDETPYIGNSKTEEFQNRSTFLSSNSFVSFVSKRDALRDSCCLNVRESANKALLFIIRVPTFLNKKIATKDNKIQSATTNEGASEIKAGIIP